jgi:hypothetical protein
MKRFLLGLALICVGASALAQVNTVPQTGLVTGYLAKPTYSAVGVGVVPAASATDIACIAGAANKKVGLLRVRVSGTAGTLVTLPVTLLRRATADTAGTPATGAALPVAAKHDSNSAAAVATLVSYTANPTINDSSPLYYGTQTLTLPVTTAGTSSSIADFSYVGNVTDLVMPLYIQGAAQQVCVNLNAISVTSGLLNVSFLWTEE